MKKKTPNNKFWKNKKIFLTGHTSFKGTWLKIWLELLGAKVIGYSLDYPSTPVCLYKLISKRKIKKENILNFNHLSKMIKKNKPDIVFHLAAQSILSEAKKNPLINFQTNVIGTASVLEACAKSKNVKLVSIITSDKCYDENNKLRFFKENSKLGGSEPYSSSKACAEIISSSYLNTYKILNKKIITLRAGNVIGGGDWKKDRIVPDIIKAIKNKSKINLRNPKSIRPWQHVLDCLNGYLIASEFSFKMKKTFNTWNFSPPLKDQISVKELVKDIFTKFKISKKKIVIKKSNLYENEKLNLSANKARKELNWHTIISRKNLINYVCDWYKSYLKGANIKELTINQIQSFYKLAKGHN